MVLSLIGLGSSSALNAFLGSGKAISLQLARITHKDDFLTYLYDPGIIGADLAYGLPIAISLFRGRKAIEKAPFNQGKLGWTCNVISVIWISLSLVLFCMVSWNHIYSL